MTNEEIGQKAITATESIPWAQYDDGPHQTAEISAQTQQAVASIAAQVTQTLGYTNFAAGGEADILEQALQADRQEISGNNQSIGTYFPYIALGGALLLVIIGLLFIKHLRQ